MLYLLRYSILSFFLIICLAGCHTVRPLSEIAFNNQPVDYSIIYLIHGDANYLYHNARGKALQADEQVLKEAKKVAQQADNGEVFIFHIRPEHRILWIFPRKDRRFWYYRNGELVYHQKYSPHSLTQPFFSEARLYQKFQTEKANSGAFKTVLLYFGHQIPAKKNVSYHHSRPDAIFNTQTFTEGLQQLLKAGPAALFDLTVLSTCNNGTPAFVHMLSPYTRYLLASPQNLHLSHIDTKALGLLDRPGSLATAALADSLATQTYRRLSSFLQTTITLSVYNTALTASYLPSLAQQYQQYLDQQKTTPPWIDNIDCARLPFFEETGASKGVKVWYKAPAFGVKETHTHYSGWGCKGIPDH